MLFTYHTASGLFILISTYFEVFEVLYQSVNVEMAVLLKMVVLSIQEKKSLQLENWRLYFSSARK